MAAASFATTGPAVAGQQQGTRQIAQLKFTTGTPGKPSGLLLRVDYRSPKDPRAKPPAIRRVVVVLAKGGRFDTGAAESCRASDVEVMLLGPSACPSGSRVGDGYVRVDTGSPTSPRFFDADVDLLNNANEQIVTGRERLTGARIVFRAPMTAREEVVDFPLLPGTPPEGGAVDNGWVRFARIARGVAGERRAYVTTPPSCPKTRFWLNQVRFTYADGVTQVVRTRQRCRLDRRPAGWNPSPGPRVIRGLADRAFLPT